MTQARRTKYEGESETSAPLSCASSPTLCCASPLTRGAQTHPKGTRHLDKTATTPTPQKQGRRH